MTTKASTACKIALIVLLTVVAYLPAMRGGFIWDDDDYVTENQTLRDLNGLKRIWFEMGATPQYYPMVHTTFWVEYQLWQLKPFGFHLVNVLLHALGSILLWRVLVWLRLPGAWLAAGIFALHPVQVESVAWITERKNVLSAVFYFGAALAYLRFRPLDGQTDPVSKTAASVGKKKDSNTGNKAKGVWTWYVVALVLFIAALLSKTVTCSLPAALLLVCWWKKGRIGWSDVMPLLPFFVIGVVLGLNTAHMEKHTVGAQGSEWALTLVERCLIAGRALWFYASKLVFPVNLTFIYPRWEINTGMWWQWLFPVGALGVVAGLWFSRRQIGRGPLVAVLLFAGTLFPALGFVNTFPMRYSFVADHFQYLACVGLVILAAEGLSKISLPKVSFGVTGLLLVALAALTWRQCGSYKDLETLWQDTIAKSPTSWMAHNNLGVILTDRGNNAEAEKHYREALRLKPGYAEALNNLGSVLLTVGKVDEAITNFLSVLQMESNNAKALGNMGIALARQGRLDESIEYYNKSLKSDPNAADVLNNLGSALAEKKEYAGAIKCFESAQRLKPGQTGAQINLANAFIALGKIDEAISQFQDVLKRDPGNGKAHGDLAGALLARNRYDEAIREYSAVTRLMPDDAGAHYNLATLLSQTGKNNEARTEYESALRLKPDYAEAHNNMGIMLTLSGKQDEAIGHYKAALRSNPDYAEAHFNLASVLFAHGSKEEAKRHFIAALQARPDYPEAHYHLGIMLAAEGDTAGAVSHWRAAVEARPDWLPALNSLAWALATAKDAGIRNGKEALRLAEHAARLTESKSPELLDTLAAAYAECSRFADAMTTAQQATELASKLGNDKLSAEIRAHGEKYKEITPFGNNSH